MLNPLLSGPYLILDPHAYGTRNLVDVLHESVEAGARLFQYRDKTVSMKEAYHQGLALSQAAHERGALLFVNDRCDLALAVEADGVHLGQDDLALSDARLLMGPEQLIGISTHTLEQVVRATTQGADYLGFGPIFSTGTKMDHELVVGIDGLQDIRPHTPLPVFAIGGITREAIRALREAGADGVAVISAVANATNLKGAVQALRGEWASPLSATL